MDFRFTILDLRFTILDLDLRFWIYDLDLGFFKKLRISVDCDDRGMGRD